MVALFRIVLAAARHYVAIMSRRRKRDVEQGADAALFAGFVDIGVDFAPKTVRILKSRAESHESRLVAAVGRANRREGTESLAGLTDQQILDRIG